MQTALNVGTTAARAGRKAETLEMSFGLPTPITVALAAIRRHDDRDIEPYTTSVAGKRLTELDARGYGPEDSVLVLLMRGARIEVLAKALGIEVEGLRASMRAHLAQITPALLYEEAWRGLDLWRRA